MLATTLVTRVAVRDAAHATNVRLNSRTWTEQRTATEGTRYVVFGYSTAFEDNSTKLAAEANKRLTALGYEGNVRCAYGYARATALAAR